MNSRLIRTSYIFFLTHAWCSYSTGASEFESSLEDEVSAIDLSDQDAQLFWKELLSGVKEISVAALKIHYRDSNASKKSSVVVTTELSKSEKEFLKQRQPRIEKALERIGVNSPRKPRIALCMSGGGFRAMLASTGFAQGLNDIGVFDTATYDAGLSGSSWHLSKLMAHALKNKGGIDFDSFVTDIVERAQKVVLPDYRSLSNLGNMLSPLIAKYVYGQTITPTDFYGVLLGSTLLDLGQSDYEKLNFSSFHKVADKGVVPLPIGTAVTRTNSHWFEFTPYQSGSAELGSFFETYGLGRKFSAGKSVDSAPEASLHNLMGIMGSAFAVKGFDAIRHLGPKLSFLPSGMQGGLSSIIELAKSGGLLAVDEEDVEGESGKGVTFNKIIQTGLIAGNKAVDYWQKLYNKQPKGFVFFAKPEIGSGGLGWQEQGVIPGGIFANPLYGIKSNKATSRLMSEEQIELKDAGIDFNLPFPPLLREERDINIIIAYDASGGMLKSGAKALKFAWDYAKAKGLRFPDLSSDDIDRAGKQNLSVFGDPSNPRELTIIYIPLLRNVNLFGEYGDYSPLEDKYTKTTNFAYPKQVSSKIIETVRQNVRYFEKQIKDVIREKAQAL